MDKKPTLDVTLENDKFVSETNNEDEKNDDAQIRNFNEENDGKFLFIYQSYDMKRIYRKYAPYLRCHLQSKKIRSVIILFGSKDQC